MDIWDILIIVAVCLVISFFIDPSGEISEESAGTYEEYIKFGPDPGVITIEEPIVFHKLPKDLFTSYECDGLNVVISKEQYGKAILKDNVKIHEIHTFMTIAITPGLTCEVVAMVAQALVPEFIITKEGEP